MGVRHSVWDAIVLGPYAGSKAISGCGQNPTAQQRPCPCTNGGQGEGGNGHIYSCYLGATPKEMDELNLQNHFLWELQYIVQNYGLILRNVHIHGSDLCPPTIRHEKFQSLQIDGDKNASLIQDAGW